MSADLLTPTVNVPAERAKLRRLRNEINADAQARLAYERNYTARGYRRAQLPDVSALEPQERPGNGPARSGALRAGAALDVPAAASDVREAQACDAGSGRAAGGMGREGWDD